MFFSTKNNLFFIRFLLFFYRAIKKVEFTSNGYFIFCIESCDLFIISKIISKCLFFNFKMLSLITCVDNVVYKKRFELFYNFLNVKNNIRFFLCAGLGYGKRFPYTKGIISLSQLFKSANWFEREIWDMFGVFFLYHIDLRRILTDYGFKGFPLRKEFPLTGFLQVRYDDTRKTIVYEKVKLMQEFRVFSFINPWTKNNVRG